MLHPVQPVWRQMIRFSLSTAFRFAPLAVIGLGLLAASGCGNSFAFRTPDPAVRFVAFGDSSTAGPSQRDYPSIMPDLSSESADAFSNEGMGGEETGEGLERLESLLASEIFPNAQMLMYWEGGNDIIDFIGDHDPFLLFSPDDVDFPFSSRLDDRLANIQANVQSAIRMANEAGLAVSVATYYPITAEVSECNALPLDILFPIQADHANAYVDRLNDALRAAAADEGAVVVDVAASGFVLLADLANYFNCNHLSAQGNEIVAQLFVDALGIASGG